MTKLQLHVRQWKDCQRCPLSLTRTNVVFCRGDIPCDVLLLGEAPGHSEDVVGQPFKGLAGHLLDQITKEVFADSGLTLCHANLVGCIPLGDDRRKLKQPSHESIAACAPRLDDFISICRPRMVVRLGVLAHKHVADGDYVMCDLVHPAHIIRKTTIQQHYDKKKCVIALTNAIAKL